MQESKRKIVILGGGTAGWMTAAALSRVLPGQNFSLTLIESEKIGTVGVGEATIPHIREFNSMLGVNEHDFMQAVNGTYKLGIRFKNWGFEGSDYFHPFGTHGSEINHIAFHHYWLQSYINDQSYAYDNFSFASVAARKERFALPNLDQNRISSTYSYAYHLDAVAYAEFLRKYAEGKGVNRIGGKVIDIHQDSTNGNISRLHLESDIVVEGDLFIDCSGFSALLIGSILNTKYEDWSQWLPCDSAYAVQSELIAPPAPYTVSTARVAGWQWSIPLQKRMGNGYVFCSKFTDDEEAQAILTKYIDGSLLTSPRKINFIAGMRTQSWVKNCVAIGLSSGFLEPLESTSIYLIQLGIYKFLELLPVEEVTDIERDEYNKEIRLEYERIRDFLILHYKLNNKQDSEFWRYCREMNVPESLRYKVNLFETTGHVVEYQKGLFKLPSWLAVYFGQGLIPDLRHPILSSMPRETLNEELLSLSRLIDAETDRLPKHVDTLIQTKKENLEVSTPTLSLYGSQR